MNDKKASVDLKLPQAAPGLPVLGNAFDLIRDPLAFFLRMYQEMGPVFTVGGGGRKYTVLAGPEANRRFIGWEDRFLTSGPVYQPYLDDLGTEKVVIAMDGEPHRDYRKWMRPGFSREAISPRLPDMVEGVLKRIEGWQPGQTINVTDAMQRLISEMSGLALAGCPVGEHFDDTKRFAHTFLGAGVGSFPGMMRLLPGYRRARARFFDFLSDVISQHKDESITDRPPDLIDLLLTGSAPGGKPASEMDILASAHMPFTNSLVYVAATCGFMLYQLLKNPEILEQVRREAEGLFASGAPSISQLRGAKWLRASLLETQRIHPISLSLPRYVRQSFEFEGHLIEAGSMTLTATAVTHFMPSYFPDPYRFDVSRYWAPRFEHRQPGALVPYGLGPHVCLSAGVVNVFVLLTVGCLLQRFDLALDPPDYVLGISVAPFPAPSKKFRVKVVGQKSVSETAAHAGPGELAPLDDALSEIDSDLLNQAVSQAESREFPAGSNIVEQGERAEELYVIVSGQVEVIKERQGAAPIRVAQLVPGDYFGEIGLLQGIPRTATVRATTAVRSIVIERETFLSLVADADLTSGEIATVMRRRLTSTALASALPDLTKEQVALFSPKATLAKFEPGVTIIGQGDPAELFYIVVRGKVDVVTRHPDGREIYLNELAEGEFFGEIGLLHGQPRNATVRAGSETGVEVVTLAREDFLAAMSGSESSGQLVALRMAERLTELIGAADPPSHIS